jgi:DNA-binding LacI/PurR family transcriptional regulator
MAVPHLDSWYFATVMASAEAVLAEAGYDLLVLGVHSPEMRRRALSGPLVSRADGLILVDVAIPVDEGAELAALGVETVSIGPEVEWASAVTVDDRWIGAAAAAHLVDLGHCRIGLLTDRLDIQPRFAVPEYRIAGFLAELAGHGLSVDPSHMIASGFSIEGGYRATQKLLSLDDRPTALFALSDEMAFGALQALGERGLRAPDALSLVGVDDHRLSAVVGLTTIQQEVSQHGTIAAKMLLDQLAEPGSESRCHRAGTRLIVRETTARLSS